MFLERYGWLICLAVIGVAIWVTALVLVIRSPKFRRKWLWALLTLFTFSFGRQVAPGVTVSAGLPIGALYVLGFWRWGPAPVETPRPTRITPATNFTTPARLLTLRIAYGVGMACCLGLVALAGTGALTSLVLHAGGPPPNLAPEFAAMLRGANYAAMAVGVVLAVVFGSLVRRPYGWGKLLCAWVGLSWSGFGLVFSLIAPQSVGPLPVAIGFAGLLMLATAAAHQMIDPRLGGPPMTAR